MAKAVNEVLCLGCHSVGKTLLVKRIKNACLKAESGDEKEIPLEPDRTVGVELDRMKYEGISFTIREVGAAMMPTWPSYFANAKILLYVIDVSNRTQIALSYIELLKILKHEAMRRVSVILVFNKIDVPYGIERNTLYELMRLDDLVKTAPQAFTIFHLSALQPDTTLPVLKKIVASFQ
eukprot:TRINITY_DN4488_c0_g3_i2.p1 TRINITY_DN4488_c0_g3~~TRINITY_DN4488_c0_g3_i2.p1  ORF type:complete len:179 (+),score=13.12 TRINITY_DN4488_c0_g3_i2:96-632(+)